MRSLRPALWLAVPVLVVVVLVLSALCAGRTRAGWSEIARGDGPGGDIIVPLNKRDPSALVMGPTPAAWRSAAPAVERPQ